MTYILLAVFYSASVSGVSTLSAEFNSKEACQIASVAIKQQAKEGPAFISVIVCAPKGEKK